MEEYRSIIFPPCLEEGISCQDGETVDDLNGNYWKSGREVFAENRKDVTYTAVVLAAGSGRRMKSDLPKQYMDLSGKPLIYYALKAFQDSPIPEIVLVVSKGDIDYCRREIVERFQLDKVKEIVEGGNERAESVLNGLEASSGEYVLIHDGARAFLTQDVITRMMEGVLEYKAAVAAVPEKNTIKVVDSENYVKSTPDRSSLWEIQTPQAFDRELLLNSYKKIIQDCQGEFDYSKLTDDAMVVEKAGLVIDGRSPKIKLIMGDYQNIKMTTPEDIPYGEFLIQSRQE